MVLWSVITSVWSHGVGEMYKLYAKMSENFRYFLKKKFSPLLVSCQALGGLPRHEEGGELFENSCFLHVLRYTIIFYIIFPAS